MLKIDVSDANMPDGILVSSLLEHKLRNICINLNLFDRFDEKYRFWSDEVELNIPEGKKVILLLDKSLGLC